MECARNERTAIAVDDVPQHFFAMHPGHARSLLRHERAQILLETLRHTSAVEDSVCTFTTDTGKLILDPCFSQSDLLKAKMKFGFVLALGTFLALAAGWLGQKWMRGHTFSGTLPPVETSLLIGIALPAFLVGILCAFEHSEWLFLRRVCPQAKLRYTPSLHKLAKFAGHPVK